MPIALLYGLFPVHLTNGRASRTTGLPATVWQRAPRGGAVNLVRPEIWSSHKRGTLVRGPLADSRLSVTVHAPNLTNEFIAGKNRTLARSG
jgi:hypothetical protein